MLTVREVAKEGRKEGDCSHRRECKQRKLLRVSELSRHDVSPNRGAIVRHYPPQIMEVSLSSLPPPPLPMQRPGRCSVVLVSWRGDEGEERSGTGRTLHQRHLCAHTGFSSQIRTELRDRAVLPVRASCCHSQAVQCHPQMTRRRGTLQRAANGRRDREGYLEECFGTEMGSSASLAAH